MLTPVARAALGAYLTLGSLAKRGRPAVIATSGEFTFREGEGHVHLRRAEYNTAPARRQLI
jgi:hypothetical protein